MMAEKPDVAVMNRWTFDRMQVYRVKNLSEDGSQFNGLRIVIVNEVPTGRVYMMKGKDVFRNFDTRICGNCRHFIGGGDWNLCCDQMSGLCYRDTKACEKYKVKEWLPK